MAAHSLRPDQKRRHMRNLIRPIFTVVLFASVVNATAADKVQGYSRADLTSAAALREHAREDATAYQLLESLTTEVGPRPAGSPGDRAAVAWAQREMQRLGFANVHTMPVVVPHWVRGEAEFSVLTPWPAAFPTLVLGGSIGTGSEGLETEAVMVKDLDALAQLPAGAVKD